MLFKNPEARSNATKVVVVITDKKSGNTEEEVTTAAMSLEEKGVRVIAVSVGKETDNRELEKIASIPDDVINTTIGENPEKVADKIMNKVQKGKCYT